MAQQALAEGAAIVVASSNPTKVQRAVERLGGNSEGKTLDLTAGENAIRDFFDAVGTFDHLGECGPK